MSNLVTRFLVNVASKSAGALFSLTLIGMIATVYGGPDQSKGPSRADVFRPGEEWRDDNGRAINSHGGGILFYDNHYYWFGEVKAGPTQLPESNRSWNGTRVDFSGISCYVSIDLLNWHYEGLALAPQDGNELGRQRVVERPKVIYNPSTKHFVMWMHIDSADYKEARCGVAISEKPTGPFVYLGSKRPNAKQYPQNMPALLQAEFKALQSEEQRALWSDAHPDWAIWARDFAGGQMARDMTLFVDDDGKAYHIYASEENVVLQISRLNDDFLSESGIYVRAVDGSREAPAFFKHKGHYFMVNSGCTGWTPNTIRFFKADSMLGTWSDLGVGVSGTEEQEGTSFHSQSACVLTLPLEDAAPIYIGDRWIADDLEKSTYVWLPIDMNGSAPKVTWKSEWRLPVKIPTRER